MVIMALLFGTLLLFTGTFVYVYSSFAKIYNTSVAPVISVFRWIFVLTDFVFRAFVPIYNGFVFWTSQLLSRTVVTFTFNNLEEFPDILQALLMTVMSCVQSLITWLENILACTVRYSDNKRKCGIVDTNLVLADTFVEDCQVVFADSDTQCFGAPNFFLIDLLTPGLYMRQAALSLQTVIASHCGLVALVLNLGLFPFSDHQLYVAVHSALNTMIYTIFGLPITTIRRCEYIKSKHFSDVVKSIACTPDWQPVADLWTNGLLALGDVLTNWMNIAAMLIQQKITGVTIKCDKEVLMESFVQDAAIAIEGGESLQALQTLTFNNGLPMSETLKKIRVIGLSDKLMAVTNGKGILYRSAHDGYVWAYGGWPFKVDVSFGLAAITYAGSNLETDTRGGTRTGLLGCQCADTPAGIELACATAPYVQHIDDNDENFNQSAAHTISFAGLDLVDMTCANTMVRIHSLRWPRKRLADTGKSGNSGESYINKLRANFVSKDFRSILTGDHDVVDNLRDFAQTQRQGRSGAVEAAIYVQPICGDTSVVDLSCATVVSNCFPYCMGVVQGGLRGQNVTMFNAETSHVMLTDVGDSAYRHEFARIRARECGGGGCLPGTCRPRGARGARSWAGSPGCTGPSASRHCSR